MAVEMVTLKLASPISADQAQRLNAKEIKDYPSPGMEITVPRQHAWTLIDAGYAAGVDPNDQASVDDVMKPAPAAAKSTDTTKSADSKASSSKS